jgi:DNA-binding response OmpR family regulator
MLQAPSIPSEKRHPQSQDPKLKDSVTIGKLKLEKNNELWLDRSCIASLSPAQSAILKFFYTHPNSIVSFSALSQAVYGNDAIGHINSLKVLIHRLRLNLKPYPPIRLDTIFGTGYRCTLIHQGLHPAITDERSALKFNDLTLCAQQLIKTDGSITDLPKLHYDILCVFFRNAQKLISWDDFLKLLVEEGSFVEMGVFKKILGSIRKHLKNTNAEIITIYGKGYSLKSRVNPQV